MPYRETSLDERKRAAALYDTGLSSREVSEVMGGRPVPQSVLRYADLYGNGRRDQSEARRMASWTKEKKRRVKSLGWLYTELKSVRKVTDRCGLCRQTVMKYLQSDYNPYAYPIN
jgi:hypothetical protein